MKTFRSRYARRVIVPVMAVSVLSACHTWKHQEMAPAQVVTEKEPDKIRLTMLDGEKIELYDPTVSNGEIVGQTRLEYDGVRTRQVTGNLGVAADSVARIETREIDGTATVVGVMLGLAFAAVVAVVAFNRGWEGVEFFRSGGFRPTGGR